MWRSGKVCFLENEGAAVIALATCLESVMANRTLAPRVHDAVQRSLAGTFSKDETEKAVAFAVGVLVGGAWLYLGRWLAHRHDAPPIHPAVPPPSPPASPPASPDPGVQTSAHSPGTYVPPVGFATHATAVQSGDSPWTLAQRFGMAGRHHWWAELKNANPQKPVNAEGKWDSLTAGESLNIPLEWTSGPAVSTGMWSEAAQSADPSTPGMDEGPFAS